MKREDIKRIMVGHYDNDFITAWDWIGQVTLTTIKNDTNCCGMSVLETSEDIEKFICSLIPTAIEFIMYRAGSSERRYRDIGESELSSLTHHLNRAKFKFNFEDTDPDWEFGGAETLIIDLEKNESYIR